MAGIRPKHRFEYALLRLLSVPAERLPYPAALAFGQAMASVFFHAAHERRNAAETRIRSVFGQAMTEQEVRTTAWISCRNVVFNAVELMRLATAPRDWPLSLFKCADVLDSIKRHTDSGRGAIIAVPHMGNWDMAGAACRLHGIPIFNIAATQKNPLVNAYLNRLRGVQGAETLERGSGAMRAVLRKLREGGALAILPDVRVRNAGIEVPFLGGRANVGRGMALFAQHAGVPILPCFVSREGRRSLNITMAEPVTPDNAADTEEDVRRMTETVMGLIDGAVRRRPEQWFWFNKRWVLDPLPRQDTRSTEAGGKP